MDAVSDLKPRRYSARPSWLPYADGRILETIQEHQEVIPLDEELRIIWILVDNNSCDFDKAAERWNELWDQLQNHVRFYK